MSSEFHLSSGALKQLCFCSLSLFFTLHMQFRSPHQQAFQPFFMQLTSNRSCSGVKRFQASTTYHNLFSILVHFCFRVLGFR
ncbi:hypothetical protein SDJN02_24870 [Cucurbita argyrosperma subsp. argyrosperma]|nr:hypothetical protein SDJN02_24870 [Cucurbita argyrosperma subsp. argyrosperma]